MSYLLKYFSWNLILYTNICSVSTIKLMEYLTKKTFMVPQFISQNSKIIPMAKLIKSNKSSTPHKLTKPLKFHLIPLVFIKQKF